METGPLSPDEAGGYNAAMEINPVPLQPPGAADVRHPDRLERPDPADIQAQLETFWQQLSDLALLAPRDEYLLLQELLNRIRRTVIALMLALNGIKRPRDTRHLHGYLGDSQQRAINSTLALPHVSREAFIAQAVALVVIYRWYAPQLVARHALVYPAALEERVWQQLRDALFDWPANITTDAAPPDSLGTERA